MFKEKMLVTKNPTKKQETFFVGFKRKYNASKRLQSLERHLNRIPFIPRFGNLGLMPSLFNKGCIALTGDGFPMIYLLPKRGYRTFTVTEVVPDSRNPFTSMVKKGQMLSLDQMKEFTRNLIHCRPTTNLV